jgi:immunoglobulin superfamily member 9B
MPSIKPQTEHKKRLKLSNFMHSNGAIFQNNLIFAWYGHDKQVTQQYAGRIHLIDSQIGVGKASINLTSVSDLNDDFSWIEIEKLFKVRESDTGWWVSLHRIVFSTKCPSFFRYECKMVYPNRSPSVPRNNGSWYHLSVDGSTLMKIPPVNQTVMEFEPAFFHCTVKNPDTMFVTWYKDNQLLSSYDDLSSRTVMGADGSILITPTLMTDLGVYSCKVKNIVDQEEYAQAFLNVQCEIFELLMTSSSSSSRVFRQSQSDLRPKRSFLRLWQPSNAW